MPGLLYQQPPQGLLSEPEQDVGLLGALYQNPLIARQVAAQRQAREVPTSVTDPRWAQHQAIQKQADNFLLGADILSAIAPVAKPLGLLAGRAAGPALEGYMARSGLLQSAAPYNPRMPKSTDDDFLTIYRGEYSGNKGGKFWTPDREFARQFTQSGMDKEIRAQHIKRSEIMDFSEKVYAGDPDALETAIKEAHAKGFKAVMVNEGSGQPNSVYWFGDNPKLPF